MNNTKSVSPEQCISICFNLAKAECSSIKLYNETFNILEVFANNISDINIKQLLQNKLKKLGYCNFISLTFASIVSPYPVNALSYLYLGCKSYCADTPFMVNSIKQICSCPL